MLVRNLVENARKRLLRNEFFAQLAFAGALFAAGLTLLLIAGTRILEWQFPLTLGLVGLVFGLARAFSRIPSLVSTAIQLDRGANTHDALSTALHFENADSQPARDAQRRQAESLLPSIDIAKALPFSRPRSLYWLAGFLCFAIALFAVRFGLTGQLDLRPTLARAVLDSLGMAGTPPAKPSDRKPRKDDFLAKLGVRLPESGEPMPADRGQNAEQPAAGPTPLGTQNTVPAPNAPAADSKLAGSGKESTSQKGDDAEGGDPNKPGSQPGDSPGNSKSGESKGGAAPKQQSPNGENASMMAKMKEALSNLLAKAKQQASDGNQQKAGGQASADKKGGSPQQAKSGQKGQQQGDGQQQGGQESASADDSTSGKSADGKSQTANGKSADQQLSSQAGSGAGKQDGAKDLKAAEQLSAMGKLSEIIGKRSQNVTGDTVLDTQSGKQPLKTAYTRSTAQHGDPGGDISRDEVPLAMQSYVQQYFQEVRKQESRPAAARKSHESAQ